VPLADLLAALEREAQASEAEELARARAEAERLRQVAAGEGTSRLAQRLAEHRRTLRGQAEARLVEARRKAEDQVLEKRRAMLDHVFEGALSLQGEVRGWPSYVPALERDVRTLLGLVRGEAVVLRCAAPDCGAVTAAAGASAPVEASAEVTAGVRLGTADGRVEMDRSLAARLEAARATLAIRLVQQVEAPR
jgi:vacuolar-type H+-ATPase subunit E/Vma4